MSMGPARLSRRSLLRGAASVAVVAAFAAVSSCADGPPRASDPEGSDDGSALLRLAHSIVADGDARASGSSTSTPPSFTSDAAAVEAIDDRADEVRSDFTEGRTAVAAGWLLSTTEAEVLTAYAGACPLPSC
jgi:hypothetical protein